MRLFAKPINQGLDVAESLGERCTDLASRGRRSTACVSIPMTPPNYYSTAPPLLDNAGTEPSVGPIVHERVATKSFNPTKWLMDRRREQARDWSLGWEGIAAQNRTGTSRSKSPPA